MAMRLQPTFTVKDFVYLVTSTHQACLRMLSGPSPCGKREGEEWMIDPAHRDEIFYCVLLLCPISTVTSLYYVPDSLRLITLVDLFVAACSLLYWYHPIKGWRRTIDQVGVVVALTYHYYLIVQHALWAFPLFLAIHWLPYAMSWIATSSREAVRWWMALHLLSHLGNVLFYCVLLSL